VKDRKVILALGEVTGHHHRFEFHDNSHNVKLYVAHGGARYLHVTKAAELLHEEHSTVTVPPGRYLLPSQVEYTPA
jgi:predicted YcjX-like family ATPase